MKDYYVKRFTTCDHLVSMLFCVLAKCSSLREVSGAMLGLLGKTKHFKLEHLPYRSTLSDANKRRNADVFSYIYHQLLMTVLQKQLKRTWAFSNLVSFCKIHLFNYIHLLKFLENPEKDWRKVPDECIQLSLF